jgi:hypothetical protein
MTTVGNTLRKFSGALLAMALAGCGPGGASGADAHASPIARVGDDAGPGALAPLPTLYIGQASIRGAMPASEPGAGTWRTSDLVADPGTRKIRATISASYTTAAPRGAADLLVWDVLSTYLDTPTGAVQGFFVGPSQTAVATQATAEGATFELAGDVSWSDANQRPGTMLSYLVVRLSWVRLERLADGSLVYHVLAGAHMAPDPIAWDQVVTVTGAFDRYELPDSAAPWLKGLFPDGGAVF